MEKIQFWNKFKSRKFQVFLIWCIAFLFAIFSRKFADVVLIEIIRGFSLISAFYIGGNVAQDFIIGKKQDLK